MSTRNILYVIARLFLAGIVPDGSFAESMSISVNGPDALRDVAVVLGARHGIAISYEGPEYVYSLDLVDHKRLVQPSSEELATCATSNDVYARFCYFSSSYEVDPQTGDPPTINETLRGIVSEYNRGENPGKFAVIETEAGPCIIPVAIRDSSGAWKPYQSLLNTRISVALSNASNVDAIRSVLGAIKDATGATILPGLMLRPRGGITMHMENKTARDVLAGLMKHPEYSSTNECWEWFFAPCPPRFGYRNNAVVKGVAIELRDDYPWAMVGNVTHPDYRREGEALPNAPEVVEPSSDGVAQ